MTLRLAILISGRGSNMKALIDYAAQDDVAAEVVLVAADQDAKGLGIAADHGIKTVSILPENGQSKAEHEARVMAAIDDAKADVIFLAGYMRLLSADFCQYYADRLFNIHPSLLPRHKGLDTHAKAIAAGDTHHGCSVHLVTAEMDDGLVLAQRQVEIAPDDNAESLADKVLAEEHQLYPALLGALAAGLLTVKNGNPEMSIGIIPGRINGSPYPIRWPV